MLWALPLAVLVVAGVLATVANSPAAAGVVLALGAFVWLLLGLAALGREVPARQDKRADAIDFGMRR